MIFYLVATIRYIRIKQRVIIEQLEKLNTHLAKHVAAENKLKIRLNAYYGSISFRIVQLYDEIAGHNHLWRHYLAIYYGCYIMEVCYFSYVFIVASGEEALRLRLVYGTFAVEFLALLLWLTTECCSVGHLNCLIHQKQRKYFQLATTTTSTFRVRVGQLLQVNFVNEFELILC